MLFSVYHILRKICIDSHLLRRNKSKQQKYFCCLLLYDFDVLSITECINKINMTETLAQTFPVAAVTETGLPDSVTGKFET